ncbi:MAG: hypothetical protein PSX36_05140 [bacterium]|nr:hypothetical protein [bacterium]
MVIIVLFTYLFSATEFAELLKVPELLEHYTEHQTKNKTISFFDFLAIHYFDAQDSSDDDGRDGALPFKSHSNCPHLAEQFNSLPGVPTSLKPALSFIGKIFGMVEEDSYATYHTSIWQPPKCA